MVVFMFRAELLEWENKILLSCKFCSKTVGLIVKFQQRRFEIELEKLGLMINHLVNDMLRQQMRLTT